MLMNLIEFHWKYSDEYGKYAFSGHSFELIDKDKKDKQMVSLQCEFCSDAESASDGKVCCNKDR